ncbi:MAG: ABC transporter substrate-binding protein [Alistipes sp.]|nr:ABC transporter substrate-binding protein [Alistipes sp.]MBQ6940570.1 ABC transporter substrate-binding protein [Alistipes sp.]
MNRTIHICLLILTLCISVSCNGINSPQNSRFEYISYAPNHASGFVINEDREGNKLLRVTRPWQGENVAEQRLAIFGSEQQAEEYEGEYIVGAVERVICMSTSHVAMLDELGLTHKIVGVSGKQYIVNEAVRSSKDICDVGYDTNLDFEAILLSGADLVILYGVSAEDSALTAKLREIGVPYIYFGDYTELTPLGKAEWLVAMAEIMGCRERGMELFSAIATRYNEVREQATPLKRPCRVMLNLPYQDVWYMPSDDSYLVRLIEDAGGEYIYKGKNPHSGSKGISLEQAVELVAKADLWLNVGQCTTLDEVSAQAPLFANMEVVRRGEVYNNNRRRSEGGGSDFWESAIVRPDVVLNDLVRILRGKSDSLYYHQRLK